MPRMISRPSVRAAGSTGLLCAVLLAFGCGVARADPPIVSAEDAACRLEAKARVFTTPNPHGLEPETIGRQIYYACMRRLAPAAAKPRHRRARRHHRHR